MRSRPSKQHNPPYASKTTSQVQNPPGVQQKIPTKLATKGKEKSFKGKRTHQRAQSAGLGLRPSRTRQNPVRWFRF